MSVENINEQEQWTPIPKFPGYSMSKDGKIRIDLHLDGDTVLRTFRELDQFFLGPFWRN